MCAHHVEGRISAKGWEKPARLGGTAARRGNGGASNHAAHDTDRLKKVVEEGDHGAERGEARADGAAFPVRRRVVRVLADLAVAHLRRAAITMAGTAG
jgi:hypothetical protein